MPVVSIDLKRFAPMVGAKRKKILERLPYVGLDIESVEGNRVRVEYSPNRPDFGTDFGIARALKGQLGVEVGLPSYQAKPSGITVEVDHRLSAVRPFIACATATGLSLDDEDIRQIISLQEDLHNGLGRKRRTVAIGLHDLSKVRGPLKYRGVESSFRFIPLDSKEDMSVAEILRETDQGVSFGGGLKGSKIFPVIEGGDGTVLSFPPVINGNVTKVSSRTTDLFIDVTSTVERTGDDVLAILATTLAEAGARIGSVQVNYGRRETRTPDLRASKVRLDRRLVERVLGLQLTDAKVDECLGRSRLEVRGSVVLAPRYRIDLLHPVDLAEEVALGYGIDRIGSIYPPSNQPGAFNQVEDFADRVATVAAGLGMTELMTFELLDKASLYDRFGRDSKMKIAVHDPRSLEHSILRDSLLPSLMTALTYNVKEDYPQRVFEIGRVYERDEKQVRERWHLGCLIAHAQANFTEANAHLRGICSAMTGIDLSSAPGSHWAFSEGRTASVSFKGSNLGHLGEVKPEALAAFKIAVPAAGFEIDLSRLRERLK